MVTTRNYGGSGSTIAKNCNISAKDGEYVYNSYFNAFPKLKEYFDLGFARTSFFGYVEFNPVTRRKYFFNPNTNEYFRILKLEKQDPHFWQSVENPAEIRRKYSRDKGEVQRISQNYRIQGSSADITKYACILFFKEILAKNWWLKVKIVNIIHDEILIEAPKELINEAKDSLIDCMKKAGDLFCTVLPLGASADIGTCWIH